MQHKDSFLIAFLKCLIMIIVIMVLLFSILVFKNYLLHTPKDITNYNYENNHLSFNLDNQNVKYVLTLPKEATFHSSDKLSIVLINKYDTPKKDLNSDLMYQRYGVKPLDIHQSKKISLFVNGNKKYDLNDNLVLQQIITNPSTGIVSDFLFE